MFSGSYKSPFTYADAKKTDGYSSFVDMEDTEKEYEEAKQGCVLKLVKHYSRRRQRNQSVLTEQLSWCRNFNRPTFNSILF